jgi:molybdopterin/thiamine biosynthesis adenylyltransferase
MARLIQVGAGSGGMVVLDLLAGDPRLEAVALIEPDVYRPHNVERHYFGPACCGTAKAELAAAWLRERRPDVNVRLFPADLCDPSQQAAIEPAVADADIGVCAVDNEIAKYHWDALMRKHGKPWTLGEVLSGGIGGFVHAFVPGGPCYGCVASFLKRSLETEKPAVHDYSQPQGGIHETRIPAGKAAIHAIASLHAVVTLQMLDQGGGSGLSDRDSISLLFTLKMVAGVFEEAYRLYRFQIAKSESCLMCGVRPSELPTEEIDVALDRALERLAGAASSPNHA